MKSGPVRAVADAVLYEGYLLYPYRRSAIKNPRRWTLGDTPLTRDDCAGRALAQAAAFASTHRPLDVQGGPFLSLTDPPPAIAAEAKAPVYGGLWPALVGGEGERGAVLAPPIILDDVPQTAPESPVDLFDGAEIEEILTLPILTVTDAEKREAAADPRALLERIESQTEANMAPPHTALGSPRNFPRPALASLARRGAAAGDPAVGHGGAADRRVPGPSIRGDFGGGKRRSAMNGSGFDSLALGMLVLLGMLSNAKNHARHLKISSM